jgi:methionine aminotransferase
MQKMRKMLHKLPSTGVTIFSVMTALANEVGAVNVSQGFPDYPADPQLCELLYQASRDGHNQYAPMPGLLALRESVAEKYNNIYGCNVDPATEITITPGATAALYTAIASIIGSGDEVIIMDPSYDSYAPAVLANNGVVRSSPLIPGVFTPDWEHVRSCITSKTRLIIVNSPHNPCGSVMSRRDIDQLALIAEEHDLLVLSDEVYELITFDGLAHHTLCSHPVLRERTFVVTSFGKTFHITGWKVGVCIAPQHLTSAFRAVHQFLSFCVNTPAQVALAAYMSNPATYMGLREMFTEKRDLLRTALAGSRWSMQPCSGSYFQLLGYENISDELDVDFAKRITREYGVATIPLSPFYQDSDSYSQKLVRVCFAKQNSTLTLAAERLAAV